jgi:hypothetical protein
MVENAAEIRLVVRFGFPVDHRRLRVAPIQAGAAHDGAVADQALLGEFGRPELGHDSSTLRVFALMETNAQVILQSIERLRTATKEAGRRLSETLTSASVKPRRG